MDRKWLKRKKPSKKLTGYFFKENTVPVHRKKDFPALLKRNKALNRIVQKDIRVVLGESNRACCDRHLSRKKNNEARNTMSFCTGVANLKPIYEQIYSQNSGSDTVEVNSPDISVQSDLLTRDKSEMDYTAKGDVRFSSLGTDLKPFSVENDSLLDEMAVCGPTWPISQATQKVVFQDESPGYDLNSSVVSSEHSKHGGVICYRGNTQELLNL